MKTFATIIISVLLVLTVKPILAAQPAAEDRLLLKISEVQTASSESASEEFIEVYNGSYQPFREVAIVVEYRSSQGSNWLLKAELDIDLAAKDHFLLASSDYLNADAQFSSGLADGGGHLRLSQIVDDVSLELDRVGWGSAVMPESAAMEAPKQGESIKRHFNEDGEIVDTDDNSQDFFISSNPFPQAQSIEILKEPTEVELPADEPESPEVQLPEPQPAPEQPTTYHKVQITELFIDPAMPLTDRDDEFIELYNPNPFSVELAGYVIKTGLEQNHSFTLPALSINSHEYIALFAQQTSLALTNSAGQAAIYDPEGRLIDQTDSYEKAKPSTSWAKFSEKWQWSTQITPNKANLPTPTVDDEAGQPAVLSRQLDGLNSGSTSSSKPNNDSTSRNVYQEPAAIQSSGLSRVSLVLLVVGAILYAIYEYRQEISSTLTELAGKLKTWRNSRR